MALTHGEAVIDNVRDLLEQEPENAEYKKYIPHFVDLLKEAMTLRSRVRGKKYNDESRRIRDRSGFAAHQGHASLGVRASGSLSRT